MTLPAMPRRGDLIAGVTVAAYLVPQVMAYAQLAGLPAIAGLWTILPALAIYAAAGSSRQLSVGPESTTALMTATVVGPLAAGDPARHAALAAALAVMVGLLAIGAWALRMGFLADLLSRPILVGYMTGVAVIMITGQLGRVSGVPVTGETPVAEVVSFLTGLDRVHAATATLALTGLLALFVMQRWLPRWPGPLVTVLAATLAVAVLDLDRRGVSVVGAVPRGLPMPALPRPADVAALLLPAVGVLLVGYTDNVMTARAFAARAGTGVEANRELLALGLSNVGAGLFRGFPVSSSGSRTALAVAAGSRGQAYSMVALTGVILVLLVAGPLLATFPSAVLGSVVIYAAVRLVDLAGFRRLAAFRRSEVLLAVAAMAGVLAVGVLNGVLIAIGLSVADLLARVARPHDAVLGRVPGLEGMHDVDDYPQARTIPGLLVYRYDSPLFFANAENFKRRALAAVREQQEPVHWFVLNMEANMQVDITGLDAVEAVRKELADRGIVMTLARVKQDLLEDLRAFGLVDRIGPDRIFPTLPSAVAGYHEWQRAGPAQPASE